MRPISLEIRKQVVRAYAQGLSVDAVAVAFGVSRAAVDKWRKAAGLSRNAQRASTRTYVRTRSGRLARQMASCQEAEEAQRLAEMPRFKRCEFCWGREDTTHPHAHKAA